MTVTVSTQHRMGLIGALTGVRGDGGPSESSTISDRRPRMRELSGGGQ